MRPVLHASLSQDMVDRLVWLTAQADGLGWTAARDKLALRWANEARIRIRHGMSTYLMYEEMSDMALHARVVAAPQAGWAS